MNQVSELFEDTQTVLRIQNKLPKLFQLTELESQRAGKTAMEVGSLRERVLVSLLIYRFGEDNLTTDIPITTLGVDVLLFGSPISIKTKTGSGYSGVKLIWTVDAQNAREFLASYHPTCHMMFAQIIWNRKGGLFYIPLSAQAEVLKELGNDSYIKLPSLGTNPRGVEISSKALERLVQHPGTYKIEIDWIKQSIDFSPYERWVELWQQD
ncbi:ThaI family type II restriction endonuclease [Dehalococcoidia bacterium]|nr:ThaI family type II restriction endonuclease [Dehalococcoidia bacterium]